MKQTIIKSSEQIETAIKHFTVIDSTIAYMFMDNITSNDTAILLNGITDNGAYTCYENDGKINIYISFDNDTGEAMDIISDLCTPIFANNDRHIEVWVRNENRHIINMLKRKYNFDEDNYEMVEFVMKRDRFNYQPIESELISCKYEPGHLDNYLVLLNEAMTYHREPYNYFDEKDIYHNKFLKNNDKGLFKAFWLENQLVGLYLRAWKNGNDIELLAVSPKYQNKGYGTYILQFAINELFTSTDCQEMFLYCVDWNHTGQNFYHKFGMKINGHSYRLRKHAN